MSVVTIVPQGSGNLITQVFSGSATLSGVWTNSNIIEDYEGRPKLVWVQNDGAGSGLISYQSAIRSGGPFITIMSGISVVTSAALYSGIRIDTVENPYPFFRIQHKDGADGSGTTFSAWVVHPAR